MEDKKEQHPRVGIGVMVIKDGKVLLGKRRGSHGAGEYAFPGGHLEYMESFEECARRETMEECGLEIKHVRFQLLSNIKSYKPKHYVHVGILADWKRGEPAVLEKNQSESWIWHDLNNLPEPLFEPCRIQIESYQTGKNYFDA